MNVYHVNVTGYIRITAESGPEAVKIAPNVLKNIGFDTEGLRIGGAWAMLPEDAVLVLKVPERAYLVSEETPTLVIRVEKGVSGYWPTIQKKTTAGAQATADELNGGPLDPRVAEAALAGSMFGWDIPAADPNRYEIKNGRAVPKKA